MYEEWINKKETASDVISDSLISKFKTSLTAEIDMSYLLGIHWCLTLPVEPIENLSDDGHIKKGKFLPPIDLEQRMWASSEINFHNKLIVNKEIIRVSEIKKIEKKIGKNNNELLFVDIEHNYFQDKVLKIKEIQTLVYKNPLVVKTKEETNSIKPNTEFLTITPSNVMLFRFSALTYNSHRIHFDKSYAKEKENYKDLIVQGPLIASLAMNLIQSRNPNDYLKKFKFRNTSPAYVNEGLNIQLNDNEVTTYNDEGQLLMSGIYEF